MLCGKGEGEERGEGGEGINCVTVETLHTFWVVFTEFLHVLVNGMRPPLDHVPVQYSLHVHVTCIRECVSPSCILHHTG